eukprot:CAMPEP_0198291964 /NCGR_PEP_ID=MMETSP1449-20131203/9286_1 /TAXON_ID=420275 /ORGANISM="Attheya septentrionalis, Strain CCMP2084" /LENGTH=399 /DNA_ID=CAMNT_0043990651 /DNA_START=269 /DNA_END=1468 /DNA_ORIENTATION=+
MAQHREEDRLPVPVPTMPVAGVWERQWEEDPLGDTEGADRDTLVTWTQSKKSGIYVDIRIPAGSPGRSIQAAQEAGVVRRPGALSARECHLPLSLANKYLDLILRQKSFAGVLEYSDGDTTSSGEALQKDVILSQLAVAKKEPGALALCTCVWRRHVDYQPPSGGLDIGVCASDGPPNNEDGSILLRETGDDGSYAEGWLRVPGSETGPFFALTLVSEGGQGNTHNNDRTGYWVRAGNRFAYAVGRPTSSDADASLGCAPQSHTIQTCVGKSLSEAASSIVANNNDKDNVDDSTKILNLIGSYVCVTGTVQAGDQDGSRISSSPQWHIHQSTNPELVGCCLVGDDTDNKEPNCCSHLSNVHSGDVSVGDEIRQILTLGEEGTTLERRWKVVELNGCTLF